MKKRKIFTVLITTILCFSVLKIYTKASFDYNVKSLSYTNGSVSISSGINADVTQFGGGTGTADICNYLSFQFDKYYSGTVTMKWTYSSSAWRQNLTDWNILVIGGKIESNNNTSGNVVFRVYDTDNFLVVMTYSSSAILNGTDPTFSFTSASSSLTAVTNHNDLYNNVDNIDSQLSTVNTQLGGIVSLLGALQNLQNTISSNVIDIADNVALESDGITNTDVETKLNLITSWIELVNGHLTSIDNNLSTALTNQGTCNELLGDIEDNTDGIEGLLTAIEGTLVVSGVSVFSQLAATQAAILAALVPETGDSLLTTLSNLDQILSDPTNGILTKLSDLNSKISDTNSKLDDIKTSLGNLLTSVNNIDNQIDTITWTTIDTTPLWSHTLNGTYSSGNMDSSDRQRDIYIKVNSIPQNNLSNLFYVRSSATIYYTRQRINGVDVQVYDSEYNLLSQSDYYVQINRYQIVIYFAPQVGQYGNGQSFYLHLTAKDTDGLIGFNTTYGKEVKYITSNDIEYWQLLSYIKQFKFQEDIINNLIIDVNSESSLTLYNNDQTTLDNIDTGLNTEYQTYLPYVNQQLSPLSNTTFLNEMSNQRTLFDYLFRNIFNLDYSTDDPSTVTNPIFLILIFGGILLALVG